jgi:hypothetical protein
LSARETFALHSTSLADKEPTPSDGSTAMNITFLTEYPLSFCEVKQKIAVENILKPVDAYDM